MGKLEELIKQEQQLKHRIQLEKNKLNAVARKRRDGKLISIESMLNDPEEPMPRTMGKPMQTLPDR